MHGTNELKDLLDNFSGAEFEMLKTACSASPQRDTKLLQLISELKNRNITVQNDLASVQGKIYPGLDPAESLMAFNKLRNRAFTAAHDILLNPGNIEESPLYDERAKVIFLMKQKMLLIEILFYRGVSSQAKAALLKLMKCALDYEVYDVLLFCLYKLRRMDNMVMKRKEYHQYIKKIEYYEECRRQQIRAEDIYFFVCVGLSNRNDRTEKKAELPRLIEELDASYNKTKASIIKFYQIFIKSDYLTLFHKYHELISLYTEAICFLKKNKSIFSKNRLGEFLINLSTAYLFTYNFETASKILHEGTGYLKINSLNALVCREMNFFIFYYEGNIHKAMNEIKAVMSLVSQSRQLTSVRSRFDHYHANMLFITKDFNQMGKVLHEITGFLNDDGNWGFYLKVTIIQYYLETEKYDLADAEVENLRKLYERFYPGGSMRERCKYILKILMALKRSGYNFRQIVKQKADYIVLLDIPSVEFSWEMGSPELIVFQEWLLAKSRDESYDHKAVMVAMKKKHARQSRPAVSSHTNGKSAGTRTVSFQT